VVERSERGDFKMLGNILLKNNFKKCIQQIDGKNLISKTLCK
jgi:hypothetical protein